MVASEAQPFSKTGGLADVATALPKALGKLGHDVTLITPRYMLGLTPTGSDLDAPPLDVPEVGAWPPALDESGGAAARRHRTPDPAAPRRRSREP